MRTGKPLWLSIAFLVSLVTYSLSFGQDRQTVKRVIYGDTLLLENGEKVRLLGVYTPVQTCPGRSVHNDIGTVRRLSEDAANFVKSLVKTGDTVKLEYDWQKEDEYGQILAYVFLEDRTFLNAEVIKQGYGHFYGRFPCKYMDDFRRYESEAKLQKRGLWKQIMEEGSTHDEMP
jgi:micrococcal nuclease